MRSQAGERQSQLELRTTVGRQEAAVAGERDDAFHQRAEKFGPSVKGNLQRVAKGIGKQMILDHLYGHLCQRHGVLVITAMGARDGEHPDQIAVRSEDRYARAREKTIGSQIVLFAMHDRWTAL